MLAISAHKLYRDLHIAIKRIRKPPESIYPRTSEARSSMTCWDLNRILCEANQVSHRAVINFGSKYAISPTNQTS